VGKDVVFESNGDAVKRTPGLTLGALAVSLIGFVEDMRIDSDGGVEFVFVEGDADEILRDKFSRSGAALVEGFAHFGDGGFHYREGALRLRR